MGINEGKIIKTILPKSSEKEAVSEIAEGFDTYELSDDYISFAESMSKIYNGEDVSFDAEDTKLMCDGFKRKVLLEVMKIPHGEVRSYKQISESINSKAYRAVGTAIANNPLPLIIPCHRVVRSDLKVGKFYGGTVMKTEILINEGVCIVNGKISK